MNLFFKTKNIIAPQTGKIIPLEKVKDPVFSESILGHGIATIPSENKILAPISGKIRQIAQTYHSISIQGENGIKILLHLGIDTYKLKGKGFTPKVSVGENVTAGDKLMEMDIDYIKSKGLETTTPCIVINSEDFKNFKLNYGTATAGKTSIITYKELRRYDFVQFGKR